MYAHKLIFKCEACKSEVALSLVRFENNLEDLDATTFDLECSCGWQSKLFGFQAKKHWTELVSKDHLILDTRLFNNVAS